MAGRRCRSWCFTLNNPELGENELELKLVPYRYLVFQLEAGESGTPHYQGFIEFDESERFAAVRARLPGAHWEPKSKNSTREQARDYCKKPEGRIAGPFEAGDFGAGGQGRRNDVAAFVAAIKQGASDMALVDAHADCVARYPRLINFVRMAVKPLDREVKVALLFGPPGCGKTRLAKQLEPSLWEVPIGKDIWLDGYNMEEAVLFDDFAGQFPLRELLKLWDRYTRRVPVKGSFVWWCPSRLIITTNKRPGEWYCYDERSSEKDALRRRIHYYGGFQKLAGGWEEYELGPLEVAALWD